MNHIKNTFFSKGILKPKKVMDLEMDTSLLKFLLGLCPKYKATDLFSSKEIAKNLGVKSIYIKDERSRFELGSFKATGATYAIAKMAFNRLEDKINITKEKLGKTLQNYTFVTASAGNHGISMAVGARLFGSKSIVFLSKTVPKAFSETLETYDAKVIYAGSNYEESMLAAEIYSKKSNHILLSDSTWSSCHSGIDVMEGYLILVEEIVHQIAENRDFDTFSHIFLQAGVGGFAAAIAGLLRERFNEELIIIIVEPSSARTLFESIKYGKPTKVNGEISSMGRLDCKEPSISAFYSLTKTANYFMHLSDHYVEGVIEYLKSLGVNTSASGGAGLAGLKYSISKNLFGISKKSNVLIFLTEGAEVL